MKNSKMSTFLRNTGAVAALVTTSALATGFLAPSASAQVSLVPQDETEIDVGFGCLTADCLTWDELAPYWIESIKSIEDTSTKTKSRLFVDLLGKDTGISTYGPVVLNPTDGGTNPVGFWFRPSEVEPAGSDPEREEKGQLEVGTYKFTFTHIIPELKIAYFDNETDGVTGFLETILHTDGNLVPGTQGTLVSGVNLLPAGSNGNIQYQILKNVSFITLKLGNDTNPGNGDGVSFQLYKKAVPEPGAAVGLGALGLMGIFGLRKRNKKSV